MALQKLLLEVCLERLKPGMAVVSMGYPDITAPWEPIRERLGDKALSVKWREDSPAICKRHHIESRDIPDSESLFEAFGCTLDVFDVVQERGTEIIVDLNNPIPENAVGQFDVCLDVGTLEHCFNAPQALMNMAACVKVGGWVMHENPFNWGNHGFWNINPTLMHDFYGDNGFEIEGMLLMTKAGKAFKAPRTTRFAFTQGEANLITIARRVEEREFSIPVQTKYRR